MMKFQAPQALMLAVGISRNGQVSLDPAMTDSAPETFSVVVEREFSHPPEKIWRALTQPQGVADEKRFQPVADHRFNLSADWGAVACRVRTVEPHRTLFLYVGYQGFHQHRHQRGYVWSSWTSGRISSPTIAEPRGSICSCCPMP